MASRNLLQSLAKLSRWKVGVNCRSFRSTSVCRDVYEIANEAEFESKVMKSTKPVLVDFYANWCGPCKTLTPVLEAAVRLRQGAVDLAKVDIDKLQDLAIRHGVTAVPTVVGVRDGDTLDRFIGAQGEEVIEAFLDNLTQQSN